MMITEHIMKLKQIFNKALYWKIAAFSTLCIQQEYQIYEKLAKDRCWDMTTHLKKTVNRFWRAVTTGYAMDDKYLLIVEESFFEPRDRWEELALQVVVDIHDLYYAVWKKDVEKTLDISNRQFKLMEKYCELIGEKFDDANPLVKNIVNQQINWAEELVAITKQDKKSFLAEISKRETPLFIDVNLTELRAQMPKEKKAKKQIPELRYMSRYIEEAIKQYIKEFDQPKVSTKRREEETTEVDDYYWNINKYEFRALDSWVIEHDKEKTLDNYYLAACAARDCINALRAGKRAIAWNSNHINGALENSEAIHYYLKSAVLTGNYDIALDIVTEDSVIGAMILHDDERAKKYLPNEFELISKYNQFWDGTLWSILHGDEKLMNNCIKDYIQTLRWQAKNFGVDITYAIADYALPLVRLAMDRGMKCTLNVYELPLELLEGGKIC